MYKFLTVLILTVSCGTQEQDKGNKGYPIITYEDTPCVSCANRTDGKENETKGSIPAEDTRSPKVLTEPEELPASTPSPTPTPTPDVEPVEVNLPPSEFESLTVAKTGSGKVNDTTLTCSGDVTDPEGDRIHYETTWEKSYDGVAWEVLPFDNQSHSIEVTYASGLFLQRPMIRCHRTAWDAKEQNRDETRSATSDVFTVVNSAPTFDTLGNFSNTGLTLKNYIESPSLTDYTSRTSIALIGFSDLDGDEPSFASSVTDDTGCQNEIETSLNWFTDSQNRTYPRLVANYIGQLTDSTVSYTKTCFAELFVADGFESVFGGNYKIQIRGY